jgi:hypothetical protein
VVLQIDLKDFAPSEWNGYLAMWVMNACFPLGLIYLIGNICSIIMLITFVRSVQTRVRFKILWSWFILFYLVHFIIVRIVMYCTRRKQPAPETES